MGLVVKVAPCVLADAFRDLQLTSLPLIDQKGNLAEYCMGIGSKEAADPLVWAEALHQVLQYALEAGEEHTTGGNEDEGTLRKRRLARITGKEGSRITGKEDTTRQPRQGCRNLDIGRPTRALEGNRLCFHLVFVSHKLVAQ